LLLLIVETVFDSLNSKAALFAIENLYRDIGYALPLMLSFTITDLSGRTLSGRRSRPTTSRRCTRRC
jgi:5-methyltetrahydrofolate--homocysteine methyltransferase